MGRDFVSRLSLHRRLLDIKKWRSPHFSSSSSNLYHILDSTRVSSSPSSPPPFPSRSFFNSSLTDAAKFQFPNLHFRTLSSPSGSSNTVLIKSEEEFNTSLKKVQDESLPAIYYFTAVWCGPCRFIAPVIGELSEKHPQVTIYKIDIDQEELGKKLSELSIMSVPTLHFFRNGKKAAEVIGADVARIKDTMAQLFE